MFLRIFNRVKTIIPKISETELIALRSGGVSIDRDIFSGKIDYVKLKKVELDNKNLDRIRIKEQQQMTVDMLDKTKNILKYLL